MVLWPLGGLAETPPVIHNWLCYYGDVFGPDIYSRFDLVVLDSHHHPPLPTTSEHPPMLGYLSVGEVDENGPYWKMARHQDFLVIKNAFWNAWMVDVRDTAWQRLLLSVAVPAIFEKGFEGVFLDTFDSSLHLLTLGDGQRFKGVDDALLKIVKSIKSAFPDKWIAVNRGLPILPEIAPWIDFVVYEDLYSYYNDQTKTYEKVSDASRAALMPYVKKGLAANPNLVLLSIDYADADQPEMALEAIRFARSKGFIPYVSTIELDQIFYYSLDH
ncbi:conserved uncharacterized protein, DUF297 [Desulfosarcina variabilis str. Montpellier]